MNSISDTCFYPKMEPELLLDPMLPATAYTHLDLSDSNVALREMDISDPIICQGYIDIVLAQNEALVCYGGYLEKRNLYANSSAFRVSGQPERNIHLGLDLWTNEGTAVLAPLEGIIHSYANNASKGDYGPTIILMHEQGGTPFFTLYGHLSLASLVNKRSGSRIEKGAILGAIGSPEVNGYYAPHLHFQLIRDLGDWTGNYPGVCSLPELEYYRKNCPDPGLVVKVT